MDTYEGLLQAAENSGLDVIDYNFTSSRVKGLYSDNTAVISTQIETHIEKTCVLAEALKCYKAKYGLCKVLGHYAIYFELLGVFELH